MNATPKTLMLALLAALLTTAPVAADEPTTEDALAKGPCESFEYSLDPPGYELRPECIPVLDNLP